MKKTLTRKKTKTYKRKKTKTYKRKKNKTYKKKGGSTIYDISTGEIKKTDNTYDGKPFFRKLYPKKKEENDTRNIEKKIVEVLMNNPNPNIVTFYDVNDRYLDMEELDTPHSNPDFHNNYYNEKSIIINTMNNVKDFLQKLGIMYIDWKFDNIAKGKDGKYKLFDFDGSGMVDLNTNKWIVKPRDYWSFRSAVSKNCETPEEIDDWSFKYNIEEKDYVCN
jgi:hypothetical protein